MTNDLIWAAGWDRATFDVLNKSFISGFFDLIMPIVSNFSFWLIPLALAWLVFFIRTGRRGRLIALFCFLVIAATDQLSSSVIKPTVRRVRPCNVVGATHYYKDGQWLITDPFGQTTYKSSFSFPSSHAANFAGQATFWSYFYPQLSPVLILSAVLVGYSRVYLGHHWPTDVLAGYLLGVFIALIIAYPLRLWVLPEDG